MRRDRVGFTVVTGVGAAALVGTGVLGSVYGPDAAALGWGRHDGSPWLLFVGPIPLYTAGLFAFWRRPDHPEVRLLLTAGTAFGLSALAEYGFGLAVTHHGTAIWAWHLGYRTSEVFMTVLAAAVSGLFPVGRPRRADRRVLLVVALAATVLLVLLLVCQPNLVDGPHVAPNPWYVGVPSSVGRAVTVAFDALPFIVFVAALAMLVSRYRQAEQEERRQIQWGMLGAYCGAAVALSWALAPHLATIDASTVDTITVFVWAVAGSGALACLLIGLLRAGVLDISRLLMKSLAYGTLWFAIALTYAAVAAFLGLAASERGPVGVAVLLTITAAMLFQPARRWVEGRAGRWVFGIRESQYEVVTRFGAALEAVGSLDDLLPHLAETVRRGLGLRWARVRFDPAGGSQLPYGFSGTHPTGPAEAVMVVPLIHAGAKVGDIDCGPKVDGPFLDADRQLLHNLARQAAAAAHNQRLSGELALRLDEIGQQAAELSASRARVVQAQDVERRRLQQDLHDGAQQTVAAIAARLALARNQLRRGDERSAATLMDLHDDVQGLLQQLRDFAHSIRPAVLGDRGLLDAVEAQAARLPLPVVIDAEPALRGVRFADQIEDAVWYGIAEALTNVLKHANAHRVIVVLARRDGKLVAEVSDDGCGFDPAEATGFGLAGLADRVASLSGDLVVDSRPGGGTRLRMAFPDSAAPAPAGGR